METLVHLGYIGMFLAAFLSGSLVPANSEIVLSALMAVGLDKWKLVAFATAGNLLGGITSYYIGYLGKIDWITRHTRITTERIEKFRTFLNGRGAWIAYFVFIPFVGDVIILVFGLMRSNIVIVTIAMFLGKLTKYVLWMYLSLEFIHLIEHFHK